jgi:general secretion pathway protein G
MRLTRTSDETAVAGSANAGFTLVEMLVVLVIIGLIMGLVGPRVLNYLTDAREKTAKIQIESFKSSIDLYYLDTARYPTTGEGLTALVKKPSGVDGWNGPYLRGGKLPNDPWGHPYVYRSPAEKSPYEITSLGPQGREGGAAGGTGSQQR